MRERELKEAAAEEIAESTRALKEELKQLQAKLVQVEKEAGARVLAAQREQQDALAGEDRMPFVCVVWGFVGFGCPSRSLT